MDDKVEEGKGWSAWQAPTTKTHTTHILVVSKKGSLLLQIPLHQIHNTHSCFLKSPQEDKNPVFQSVQIDVLPARMPGAD